VVDAKEKAKPGLTTPLPTGRSPQLTDWLAAIAITIVAGVARLAIGATTPLFPDETYYWEWSRHLAGGYFDHPPAIAWLIRVGTLVAGDTPLGVRLGPALAGTLGTFFLCAAARRLADDRAAMLAALIFAVMPLSAAGLILATPDAPLLASVAGAVYALVRVVEHPPKSRESLLWWLVAGLALGLGLLSKYTAVLLPLGVFVALLARRELRKRLQEPGPYVATVVALVAFLPAILWNARHDWISFAFQLQHGLAGAGGSVLKREADLLGGQIGLVSPILFALCAIAVVDSLRRPASAVHPLLGIVSVVVFVFFMYSATRRRVEANWPAIAYVPAVLLLVARARTPKWDRWMRGGVVLSGVLTLATYVNAFVPILPVPARRDPAARAHGWADLASAVRRIHGPRLSISSYRTHIATDRYQEASELAFHLPDHPEAYALNLSSRRNQYDLWPGFPQRAQVRDALILVTDDVEGTHPTAVLLEPHFRAIRKGEPVSIARDGDITKHLRIWLLDGWRGTWPERQLRSR
jgi:4-amino-4-deoxy-L-arabinose transferase-like glycosyltransferase